MNRPDPPQHHETAGEHLVANLETARPDEPVDVVLDRLRKTGDAHAAVVFVTDAEHRLLGQVALPELLRAKPEHPIGRVMEVVPAVAQPEMDQELAASIAVGHGVAMLPVVDAHRQLIGVLPPETLMAILRAEHLEDLHRLAGVHREQLMAREAIEAPPMRRVRHRLPWLLVGLAGSGLATLVMSSFEATLQSTVAVAFFVPAIVYLADAIGTQTEAAAVRGLSLVHEPLPRLVWGELRTGVLMGLVLAALALPAVWLGFGDGRLALAVAGALLAAGAVATTVGLLLPWALARAGRDPAYGSGPLATVIQDVLSILIYLAIASLVVR
jgi:magnesium transporter